MNVGGMADEAGKGGEGTGDVEEGVTNGVAKGSFGGGAAGEKMVAVGVEEGVFAAGTMRIEEGVWEDHFLIFFTPFMKP